MSYPPKEIFRNFLSVVAGVLGALVIIIPIFLFGAFMQFSDSELPAGYLLFSNLILTAGILTGGFAGGYITVKISTRKNFIHLLLTTSILIFLYCYVNDFDFRYTDLIEKVFIFLIPASTYAGGIYKIRKKIIRDTDSSQPDTP